MNQGAAGYLPLHLRPKLAEKKQRRGEKGCGSCCVKPFLWIGGSKYNSKLLYAIKTDDQIT